MRRRRNFITAWALTALAAVVAADIVAHAEPRSERMTPLRTIPQNHPATPFPRYTPATI